MKCRIVLVPRWGLEGEAEIAKLPSLPHASCRERKSKRYEVETRLFSRRRHASQALNGPVLPAGVGAAVVSYVNGCTSANDHGTPSMGDTPALRMYVDS
jgi:hypothetical protein